MSTAPLGSTLTGTASLASLAGGGGSAKADEAGSAERFLKLLVTQMQNQDPLNPMDNAEITSQMAQINTVSGIDKLNRTIEGLSGQFLQMQALQGASLVGRTVTLQGDRIALDGSTGVAGVELAATADRVKVEVLSPGGRVVDTLELGALGAGRHGFEWDASKAPALSAGSSYTFRVAATQGTLAVPATPLMRDRVDSVSSGSDGLVIHTRASGPVPYTDVKAFN